MSKEKTKGVRSRWFVLILYPDNMHHMDILSYLKGEKEYKFPYQACYILHQPEKDEKKEHYHVVLRYPNARTAQGVADSFGKGDFRKHVQFDSEGKEHTMYEAICDTTGIPPEEIEVRPLIVPREGEQQNTCSAISDIHAYAMYLLHQTYECIREGKHQYALSDIKACNHDNEFISSMFELDSLRESGSPVWQIMDYMEQNSLKNMSQLLRFLFLNDEHQLIKYVEKHTYLIKQLF